MENSQKVDFLIVGQGLAGSALALSLLAKGKTVLVADDQNPSAASRVAAGLITPLAGKGMNPAWRQDLYLPEAIAYYKRIEALSGLQLLYKMPVVRPFDDAKQRVKFERKQSTISKWLNQNINIPEGVKADAGAFSMAQGGRIDTLTYLLAVRKILGENFTHESITEQDLEHTDTAVKWGSRTFGKVIFCMGFSGLNSHFFNYIPHRSAKGEMLTVKIEGLAEDQIISRGGWLVPLGDQRWRAGATYQWEELDTNPTRGGRAEVEQRIENLISQPFEVEVHNAGIRPIVNRSQPIIGMHKDYPNLGIFNGLGSKGVITSPSVARHFAEYLCGEVDLDPELDLSRLF